MGGTVDVRARCAGLKSAGVSSARLGYIPAGRGVRFLAGPSSCLYTNASSLSVLYTGGSMSIGADLSLGSMLRG